MIRQRHLCDSSWRRNHVTCCDKSFSWTRDTLLSFSSISGSYPTSIRVAFLFGVSLWVKGNSTKYKPFTKVISGTTSYLCTIWYIQVTVRVSQEEKGRRGAVGSVSDLCGCMSGESSNPLAIVLLSTGWFQEQWLT